MGKDTENKRVLIVGEHSYIGKRLAQELKSRHVEVKMVGARNQEWKTVGLEGYNSVVIVAAIVHRKETAADREIYQNVNRDMPLAVAQRAKEAGVNQVVFLSSMAIFGNQYEKITFQTKPKPESFYGRYKYEAELELQKMEEPHFHVAIVRPPMVYGENCPGNYGRLKKLANYMCIFPDTGNKRSMIEIGRLANELSKIILKNQRGIFHPQDVAYVNTAKMVQKMRAEMGKKTYLFTWMNWIIVPLSKKVGIVRKIFGNLWYSQEE